MKNKSIKVLIVDDEPDALELMSELLGQMNGVEVVGKAANKYEAVTVMLEQKPDVIFQDIQMHRENGIEMVDEYRRYKFGGKIVFVTAHSQYAIEAIKKAAFDYLLKPVDLDELQSLILRLHAELISAPVQTKSLQNKLKIPTRTGYLLVSLNDIAYCEADGNYTRITMSDGEQITTSVHLGKLEEELENDIFFRISRSVIMNINYLASVNKGKQECALRIADKSIILHISSKRIGELEALI